MSDPLPSIWNSISTEVTDTQSREKLENIAIMLASVGVATAVPGLGEIQMGIQFLDFIDPYGYNQAITRGSLDTLLDSQYQNIQNMQATVAGCYTTADSTQCAAAGITPAALQSFQALPQTLQDKRIKSLTSWATPYPPEVNYPDMMLCTLATSPERIQSCQDSQYKQLYMDYWNANQAEYQADAQAAYQKAINAQAASLDNSSSNKQKTLVIAAYVVCILIIFLVVKKLV